jgi:hypothetical protein
LRAVLTDLLVNTLIGNTNEAATIFEGCPERRIFLCCAQPQAQATPQGPKHNQTETGTQKQRSSIGAPFFVDALQGSQIRHSCDDSAIMAPRPQCKRVVAVLRTTTTKVPTDYGYLAHYDLYDRMSVVFGPIVCCRGLTAPVDSWPHERRHSVILFTGFRERLF